MNMCVCVLWLYTNIIVQTVHLIIGFHPCN